MTPQEFALTIYLQKEAGWTDDLLKSDAAGEVLEALHTGKWRGVDVPWLTAGLGGLAGAGVGMLFGGQNRGLGALAGGLLGAAGGYGLGGESIRKWLADWIEKRRNALKHPKGVAHITPQGALQLGSPSKVTTKPIVNEDSELAGKLFGDKLRMNAIPTAAR